MNIFMFRNDILRDKMKFRVLKNSDGIFKLQSKKSPWSKWKDSENTPKYENDEWIIVVEFGTFVGKNINNQKMGVK